MIFHPTAPMLCISKKNHDDPKPKYQHILYTSNPGVTVEVNNKQIHVNICSMLAYGGSDLGINCTE